MRLEGRKRKRKTGELKTSNYASFITALIIES